MKQETVTHSYPLMKIILNREVNNHSFLSLEYAGHHYNMGQLAWANAYCIFDYHFD